MLRWRLGFSGLFLFCASTIGFALYLQETEFLSPCPLCILQRIGFIVCGFLCLLAALFPIKRFSWFWPVVITVFALIGAGISARHIQIQYFLDPHNLASCGAGFVYMIQTQPIFSALGSVLAGHGECAVIDWTLFGLSLPVLALIGFLFLIESVWLIRFLQSRAK
jgi:disulfide bond formation protein DsbB